MAELYRSLDEIKETEHEAALTVERHSLKLTDAQFDQMQKASAAQRAANRALYTELYTDIDRLRVKAEAADDDGIKFCFSEIDRLHQEIQANNLAYEKIVDQVLSPAQHAKLEILSANRTVNSMLRSLARARALGLGTDQTDPSKKAWTEGEADRVDGLDPI